MLSYITFLSFFTLNFFLLICFRGIICDLERFCHWIWGPTEHTLWARGSKAEWPLPRPTGSRRPTAFCPGCGPEAVGEAWGAMRRFGVFIFILARLPQGLVSSGCHNRTPPMRQLMSNRGLFLGSGRSPRRRPWQTECLLRATSWSTGGYHFAVPAMAEGMRGLSGVFFVRALIPFMEVPPLDLITSRRPHLLIPSRWAWGFNIRILEHADFQYLAPEHCPLSWEVLCTSAFKSSWWRTSF